MLKRIGISSNAKALKEIVNWGSLYKEVHLQVPSAAQFKAEYGLENIELFRKLKEAGALVTHESQLELMVLDYLESVYLGSIVRHHRPRFSDRILELDIYLPELKLGFEVQDFASHSRDKEGEIATPAIWGVKKGPAYHREKRQHFAVQGITTVELWQDEILDRSFRVTVDKAVVAVDSSLHVALGSNV